MTRKDGKYTEITAVELLDTPCVLKIDYPPNIDTIEMTIERKIWFHGVGYEHAATVVYNCHAKHFWTVIFEEGGWYEAGRQTDHPKLETCEADHTSYRLPNGVDRPCFHIYVRSDK